MKKVLKPRDKVIFFFVNFLGFVLFGLIMSQYTAMVMSGWSVQLTTLFSWASLTKR